MARHFVNRVKGRDLEVSTALPRGMFGFGHASNWEMLFIGPEMGALVKSGGASPTGIKIVSSK